MPGRRTRSRGRRATAGARPVAKATGRPEPVAAREDPRVRRTRELIVEAFVCLCGERGYGRVSVADVARRAGINRATFYRHFEDKSDLQARGIDGILAAIGDRVDEGYDAAGDDRERAVRRIETLFDLIGGRRELFLALASGAAGPTFTRRIEAFIEGYIEERRVSRSPREKMRLSVPREILPRAISSLLLGLVSWWLEHPGAIDARGMADHYITLVTRGASAGGR